MIFGVGSDIALYTYCGGMSMGINCYFQVLKLVALATTTRVTELCMDDYTKCHLVFSRSSKNWQSRPFVMILRDTYGYFIHKNNGYNRKTFHFLFLESQSLAHSQIQMHCLHDGGAWPMATHLLYNDV